MGDQLVDDGVTAVHQAFGDPEVERADRRAVGHGGLGERTGLEHDLGDVAARSDLGLEPLAGHRRAEVGNHVPRRDRDPELVRRLSPHLLGGQTRADDLHQEAAEPLVGEGRWAASTAPR